MTLIRLLLLGLIHLGFLFMAKAQILPLHPKQVKKSVYNEHDFNLLMACLDSLQQAQNDTTKISQLNKLSNKLHDETLWPKYNKLTYLWADSLLNATNNKKEIKTLLHYKSVAVNNFGYLEHVHGNRKDALSFYKEALAIQTLIGEEKEMAHAINNIGALFYEDGNNDSALVYYNKSLDISLKHKDVEVAAQACSNIGKILELKGNMPQAIKIYERGLNYLKGDKYGEKKAQLLGRIANIHKNQGEYENALKYQQEGLEIFTKLHHSSGISQVLNNIGTIYSNWDKYTEALNYFTQSLEAVRPLKRLNDQAGVYLNIAKCYENINNFDEALLYLDSSLALREELKDKQGIASTLGAISKIRFRQKKFNESRILSLKAIGIGFELGYPMYIKENAEILADVYEMEGNSKEALKYLRLHIKMKDSLRNQSNKEAIIKQRFKFEYEKQHFSDSLANEKKEAMAQAEINQQKLRIQSQNQKVYLLIVSVGMIASISLLLFWAFRRKKKDNLVILKQNELVTEQKLIVEEKNKEIIDSINYAQRIQQAMLRPEKSVNVENCPEHFILFQPKDIVSGDFYWMLEKDEYFYFAVVDCTGHGVPGAFMSMLGISFLNQITAGDQLLTPADILNQLRNRIIQELSQTGGENETKDGMDMSLIRIHPKKNQLMYAGAFNPLWIMSTVGTVNNDLPTLSNEIYNSFEIRADRMPIGISSEMTPFNDVTLQVNENDVIFLFTDGFADQFGGAKGKKLKYKPFKKILLDIAHLPPIQQKEKLTEAFDSWRGDFQQIDDVCVFGIKC